jgi:hypothetical protein
MLAVRTLAALRTALPRHGTTFAGKKSDEKKK